MRVAFFALGLFCTYFSYGVLPSFRRRFSRQIIARQRLQKKPVFAFGALARLKAAEHLSHLYRTMVLAFLAFLSVAFFVRVIPNESLVQDRRSPRRRPSTDLSTSLRCASRARRTAGPIFHSTCVTVTHGNILDAYQTTLGDARGCCRDRYSRYLPCKHSDDIARSRVQAFRCRDTRPRALRAR